jgi:hypothetical protein
MMRVTDVPLPDENEACELGCDALGAQMVNGAWLCKRCAKRYGRRKPRSPFSRKDWQAMMREVERGETREQKKARSKAMMYQGSPGRKRGAA